MELVALAFGMIFPLTMAGSVGWLVYKILTRPPSVCVEPHCEVADD